MSFPIKCEIIDESNIKAVDERIPLEFLIEKDTLIPRKFKVFERDKDDEIIIGEKGTETYWDGYFYFPYIPIID